MMWARVSRYQFPAAEVDEVIAGVNAAMERFVQQPGLKRADVLVSRKSGAGITITVWEDAEAMKSSSEEADRLREGLALDFVGWVQSVEEYELVRTDVR